MYDDLANVKLNRQSPFSTLRICTSKKSNWFILKIILKNRNTKMQSGEVDCTASACDKNIPKFTERDATDLFLYNSTWSGTLQQFNGKNEEIEARMKRIANELFHVALQARQVETVAFLLHNGAEPKDLNKGGDNLFTSLLMNSCTCLACLKKCKQIIDILYFTPNSVLSVTRSDTFAQTVSSLKARKCPQDIMSHFLSSAWEIMTQMSETGYFPLADAMAKMPDSSVDEIVNHLALPPAITCKNDNRIESLKTKITLNFKPIMPSDAQKTQDGEHRVINQMKLLCTLIDVSTYAREKLLAHPLITAFVYLKAKRFKKFLRINMTFYLILAFCISAYVLNVHLTKCKHTYRKNFRKTMMMASKVATDAWKNLNDTDIEELGEEPESYKPKKKTLLDNMALLLETPLLVPGGSKLKPCAYGFKTRLYGGLVRAMLGIIVVKVLATGILAFRDNRFVEEYLSPRNWRNWMDPLLFVTAFLTCLPPSLFKTHILTYYQYQVAACGVLVVWSMLLLQIGMFQTPSIYIEMFIEVAESLFHFFATFGVLFIGLALSTSVLFANQAAHYTFPRSLLKVLAMATGEYDYEEIFYKAGDENDDKQRLRYPWLAHIFYLLFIIVVAIALMNLLVGLAVGNVEEIQKDSKMTSLKKTIRHITHLEQILLSLRFPTCFGFRLASIKVWEWIQLPINAKQIKLTSSRYIDCCVKDEENGSLTEVDKTSEYTFTFNPYDPSTHRFCNRADEHRLTKFKKTTVNFFHRLKRKCLFICSCYSQPDLPPNIRRDIYKLIVDRSENNL